MHSVGIALSKWVQRRENSHETGQALDPEPALVASSRLPLPWMLKAKGSGLRVGVQGLGFKVMHTFEFVSLREHKLQIETCWRVVQ